MTAAFLTFTFNLFYLLQAFSTSCLPLCFAFCVSLCSPVFAFSLLGVDPFRLASGWFHRVRANLTDAARSPYLFDPPPNWPLGRQGNEVCALLFQHVIPGLRRNFALAKKL